jgi:hypothetical protein
MEARGEIAGAGQPRKEMSTASTILSKPKTLPEQGEPSLLPAPTGFPARRVVRVITAVLATNLPFQAFLDETTHNF